MTAKRNLSSQIRSKKPNLDEVPREYLEKLQELSQLFKSISNDQRLASSPSMEGVTLTVNPHKDDDHV
jgi:hypothetical protein